MLLLPNCKQTHKLVSEGLDRHLTLGERTKMKLHLAICESCTNFNGQMQLLRKAMHEYPAAGVNSDEEMGK
ncbi:MAG: zf-HC2 domain-containing protein [Pseudomonadota bacterium]